MRLNQALTMAALVAGSLFTGNLAAQAQDTNTPAPPPASPGSGPVRARNSFDMVAKQLDLTQDQMAQVKPIFDDMQKQIRDLRNDTTIPNADKRTKMRDIRSATTDKLKALNTLSDDQLAKWQKMNMGNRRPPGAMPPSPGSGTPPPPPAADAPAAPAAPAAPTAPPN